MWSDSCPPFWPYLLPFPIFLFLDMSSSLMLRTFALALLSALENASTYNFLLYSLSFRSHLNVTPSEWPFLTTQGCSVMLFCFIFFVELIMILCSYYLFDSLYWSVFSIKLVSSFEGMDLKKKKKEWRHGPCLCYSCCTIAPRTMLGFPHYTPCFVL